MECEASVWGVVFGYIVLYDAESVAEIFNLII